MSDHFFISGNVYFSWSYFEIVISVLVLVVLIFKLNLRWEMMPWLYDAFSWNKIILS